MYQNIIQSIDPTVNAVGIECAMRNQYGTLDHLSFDEFAAEIRLLKRCEEDKPGFLRRCSESYGQSADFDAAEGTRHGRHTMFDYRCNLSPTCTTSLDTVAQWIREGATAIEIRAIEFTEYGIVPLSDFRPYTPTTTDQTAEAPDR